MAGSEDIYRRAEGRETGFSRRNSEYRIQSPSSGLQTANAKTSDRPPGFHRLSWPRSKGHCRPIPWSFYEAGCQALPCKKGVVLRFCLVLRGKEQTTPPGRTLALD